MKSTNEEDPSLAHELIRARCEHDLELFCELFFPHYCEYPFNEFHRDCFAFYRRNPVAARVLDCAPRGYAKSTVKGLFKPIHDICYRREKYILFISATTAQAIQKLKDIRSEILNNDFLLDVYGVHFPSKKVGSEAFEVVNEDWSCLLQAVGSGTEVRGIRYGEARPSKIILDDVEDSDEVYNEELRQKMEDWFNEVVTNLGDKRTSIEIVGTVLHRDSLLMRLKKNPAYKTKVYRSVIEWSEREDLWHQWRKVYSNLDNENREQDAVAFFEKNKSEMLKGTQVLWPEKEPYYDLMKQLVEKGKRAFMKEKQNAPLPSDEAIFDNIHWYYEDPEREGIVIESTGTFIPYKELIAYGAMDPATGGKAKTKNTSVLDFTVIASGLKDSKGRLFVHRDWTKKAKPSRYIPEIFEQHELMQYVKFGVEENLYRGLLTENIVREKKRRQDEMRKKGLEDWKISVPFYEIENTEKKEKRIFTLEPKINNGWILFNRTLSLDFMNMVEEFPKGDHDDAPDALEMLWSLVTNRYEAKPLNFDAMRSR